MVERTGGKDYKGETVLDVVVANRIARETFFRLKSADSMEVVDSIMTSPQQMHEKIREEAAAELGPMGNFPIATQESVHPGDFAFFKGMKYPMLETISIVNSWGVSSSYSGVCFGEAVVLTREGQVILGRDLVERSFPSKVPSET